MKFCYWGRYFIENIFILKMEVLAEWWFSLLFSREDKKKDTKESFESTVSPPDKPCTSIETQATNEDLDVAADKLTFVTKELTIATKKLPIATEKLPIATEKLTTATEKLAIASEELAVGESTEVEFLFSDMEDMEDIPLNGSSLNDCSPNDST